MTKGHNNGGGGSSGGCIEIFQQEDCRVAYTLNNRQPVRCSIIGDQPLFYMDFEGEIEDEMADSSDPFGIDSIEQGVAALRERLTRLETATLAEENDTGERVIDFIAEQAFIIGAPRAAQGDELRLKALENTLSASRLAAAFLETARSHKIRLAYSTQVEHAFYDRDAGTIYLNPCRDETEQALLAVRELRRAWQHKSGALLHPLTFHPDQAILINRAQHADLAVAMIRAAWELQLSGNKAVWARLERSSFADLTRAFAREAYLDFRTLNNGQAASAVFESWFLSDRCRHEDRNLIQHMLSDYRGYMFDSEAASRTVSADLIMALGSMPFGKNYLAPFVATILADPIFAEVRDRSNANFLWFIKFERSFREAEQDLQTMEPIPGHGVSSGKTIKTNLDGDTHEQASAVIPLPGMASRSAPQHTANPRGDRLAAGGNVVRFPALSGKRQG